MRWHKWWLSQEVQLMMSRSRIAAPAKTMPYLHADAGLSTQLAAVVRMNHKAASQG
jgi:hypothetical protein